MPTLTKRRGSSRRSSPVASKLALESVLETRCVDEIAARGGMALKLVIPGVRGFPDRTVLMPGRRAWFAEFKRLKTGRVSAQQDEWARKLRALGFGVYFIDRWEQFLAALTAESAD